MKGLMGTGPMRVYGVTTGIPNKHATSDKDVEQMPFLVAAKSPQEAAARAHELARAVADKRKQLPPMGMGGSAAAIEEWASKAVDRNGQVRAA